MVDGVQQSVAGMNLQRLQQGGEVALTEIKQALFSDVGDPAEAQRLAQQTLKMMQENGIVPLDSPDSGAMAGSVSGLGQSLDGARDNVGFDMQMVMQLFHKLAQNMRETARNERQNELTMQATAMDNAAQKIRDAAYKRFVGAMVQGSMQIGGGLASGAAAGYGLKSISAANKATEGIADTALKTQVFSNLMKKPDAIGQLGSATSQALQGVGTMTAGGMDFAAAGLDAEKAELDKLAMLHESSRDAENETMQRMQEIISEMREKVAAIQQSAIETNRGIARNI